VSETRGGSDWPQPEVYSAAGLLQAGAPERSPARTAASYDRHGRAVLSPLLILTQNSAHFNAGADKLQTLIKNFN
jgi:hypothetical protein